MRKTIYMIIAAGAIMGMASCEKESAFAFNEEEGMFDSKKLDVDYVNSERVTRAGTVSTDNFIVRFINQDNATAKSYLYKQLPQVVSLPQGKYKVVADFGGNPTAGFDSVYYRGEINEIEIKPNQITQPENKLTCVLSNIKVAVSIEEATGSNSETSLLGDDVQVVVKVGDEGTLTYEKGETRPGYFRYVEKSSTIIATFSGTVDGNKIEGITKTFSNAAAGNYYTIKFTVAKPSSDDPASGGIGGSGNTGLGIDLETTINSVDVTVPDVKVDDPYDDVIEGDRENDRNPSQGEENKQ